MKILITAGPTQEAVDPVRYLTNRSSGKMGYALAAAAAKRGHRVLLISQKESIFSPSSPQPTCIKPSSPSWTSKTSPFSPPP
ncbi:phosphopantothenoylcysteine decarboxylase [Akkermansiaceae bacterium]|nr:phosphopantothenoylcysteine decarboxylase [Akkermansiaceae bacterium]